MSTVQEHILNSQGSSTEKEVGISQTLHLPIDENFLLYPSPVINNRSTKNDSAHILNVLKTSKKQEYTYPIDVSFNDSTHNKIGENLILPNEENAPFLPFFSSSGIIESIENNGDGTYSVLSLGQGENQIKIAVFPQTNSDEIESHYEVALANYSEEDFNRLDGLKDLYRNKYSPHQIKERKYKSPTSLFAINDEGVIKKEPLVSSTLTQLEGRAVLGGHNPDLDYVFCDISFQAGPFGWPMAWYTKSGIPVVHALFVSEKNS